MGRRLESGTRTLSKNSEEVTDARRLILCLISWAVKPGVPFSTTKPWMPSSVCAQTMAMSARLPLVIHILEPLITQSPPSLRAWVFMLAGSEPPCGSVRPKQPITLPAAMSGSQRWRCSSLP